MSIGNKIRQIRQDKHIKQEDLAQHLNMSQGTLSKIENDSLSITAIDLLKIAAYTNISINKLLPNGVQLDLQNSHDNANGIFITHAQKDELLQKKIADLEDLVKDLKIRNLELQEKVQRKDAKIERLKTQITEAKEHR